MTTLVLTSEEEELIKRYRSSKDFRKGFYAGIAAASKRIDELFDEAGGGRVLGRTPIQAALKAITMPNLVVEI